MLGLKIKMVWQGISVNTIDRIERYICRASANYIELLSGDMVHVFINNQVRTDQAIIPGGKM